MLRQLPRNRSSRQNCIINAVEDFCGNNESSMRIKTNASLWLMGRKKGIELNEDEKYIVWYVERNLADDEYRQSIGAISI